jgi:arylsulfatase A-like enzyme
MTAQPNIILIMTDHFRPDAVGPSTPNLLRLANNGVRFDNAYAGAPLCQPSRVSIVTGLYPSQNGVCGNMATPITDDLRDDTIMQHLQQAGYYTALVGKHHYIDAYGLNIDVVAEQDEAIRQYGFDYVWQVVDCGENMHNNDRYTHFLRDKGLLEMYRQAQGERAAQCGEYPLPEQDCEDAYIGRIGREFIEQYAEERPFYLNLSFVGPHPPYWHPGDLQHDPAKMSPPLGAPDTAFVRERRAHYMDKCAVIDRVIGQLLATLESQQLMDNTIIIFVSDHGDCLGDFGIWDKRFFYEQSAGVPMIMHGPGVRRGARDMGGKRSKALVSLLDLYPTILSLAGVALDDVMQRRAGRDLLAVLNEEKGAFRDELFAELGTAVMIRTGNWKLVFDPEQGGVQFLFNLANDPTEATNLAGMAGYEQVTLDLVQRLLAQRIRLTQYTHDKEEQRVQRVRIR